jgi:putative ABC transport system substrate-binding protein
MVEPGAAMLRSAHREGATMKTLALATILALSLLVAPLAAGAQQEGKIHRLGILTPGARPASSFPTTASLVPLSLREMGYVEGQNLIIEERFAEGKLDRLLELARELVQLRVECSSL